MEKNVTSKSSLHTLSKVLPFLVWLALTGFSKMLIIHHDTWQLLGLKAPWKWDVFEDIQQRNLLGIFSKMKLFMLVLGNSKLEKKKRFLYRRLFSSSFPPPSSFCLTGQREDTFRMASFSYELPLAGRVGSQFVNTEKIINVFFFLYDLENHRISCIGRDPQGSLRPTTK